jgi:ABC-type amino acid transport substrate-binding protein
MLRALLLTAVLALTASLAAAQTYPGSRLEQIKGTKSIRIAYRADATPFSFVNERKEPVGYSVDLCKLVVGTIERQLGVQPLNIQWVPVTTETRFDAVAKGQADMECSSSTVTLGRMKQVDFSSFIFVESTAVAIKTASSLRSIDDMAGKTIAVIPGTTNERALADGIRLGKLGAKLVHVKDREDGVAALESGKVDGFASDKLLLAGAPFKDPKAITLLPEDLSFEPYGIVLPRGDWAFRLAVDSGLAEIYRSGQIVRVFEAWFGRVGLHPGMLLRAAYMFGALPE